LCKGRHLLLQLLELRQQRSLFSQLLQQKHSPVSSFIMLVPSLSWQMAVAFHPKEIVQPASKMAFFSHLALESGNDGVDHSSARLDPLALLCVAARSLV
jgi:hypothetical protein